MTKKIISIVGVLLACTSCSHDAKRVLSPEMTTQQPPVHSITLGREVHQTDDLRFIEHNGLGAFDSYLSMEIPFAPINEVFSELKKHYPNLNSRGEAHITVITPVEYRPNLERKISIDEINKIALQNSIQLSSFEILGVGSGSLVEKLGQHEEKLETFFLVVKSNDLLKIRRIVHRLFIARGGDPKAFDPEHFHPHITVGFTKRDLHFSDGVVKDERSLDRRYQLNIR